MNDQTMGTAADAHGKGKISEGEASLWALFNAFVDGSDPPDWAKRNFIDCFNIYNNRYPLSEFYKRIRDPSRPTPKIHCKSLDEAFDMKPKRTEYRARQRRVDLTAQVYSDVQLLHGQGYPVDEAMFVAIGKYRGISAGMANRFYRFMAAKEGNPPASGKASRKIS